MIPPFLPPAPIESLCLPGWENTGVTVEVLRLDAWDVFRGGNKYFKLLYNVEAFLSKDSAFSKHNTLHMARVRAKRRHELGRVLAIRIREVRRCV